MDLTKAPPPTDPTRLGVATATNAAATSQSNAAAGPPVASSDSTAVTGVADRVHIHPLDVAAALQILIAEVRAELPLPAATSPGGTALTTLDTELSVPAPQTNTSPLLQVAQLVASEIPEARVPTPGPPTLEPLPEPPRFGGGPPLTRLPGIPSSLELDLLEPLLMPPGTLLAMPSVLTLLSNPAQAAPVLMRMFLQAVLEAAGNPTTWSATVRQLEGTLQSALDRAVSTVEQWHDVPQVVVDAARETRDLVVRQLSEEPPGPLWLRPEWMWLSPQMERFRRRRRLARRGLSDPDLWPLPERDSRNEVPGERKYEPKELDEEP